MVALSKHVLIVQGPVGGAHLSMAHAIEERLVELEPTVTVSVVNAYSTEFSSFPITTVPSLYNTMTAHLPRVWGGVYHLADDPTRFHLVDVSVSYSSVQS